MKLLRKLALGFDENEGEDLFFFKGNRYQKMLSFNLERLLLDIRINKDFRISTTVEHDKKYLWIAYCCTTPAGNIDRQSRSRLLSLVFNNFPEAISAIHNNTDDENEIGLPNRLYITSKLFEKLREAHKNDQLDPQVPFNVQHELLRVKLRPYQCRTVRWLVHRELSSESFPEVYKVLRSNDATNENLFLNVWDLSLHTFVSKSAKVPTGGILADEMGLGKTVEMLTLMLLNPRKLSSCEDNSFQPNKKIKLESKFYCICSKPRNKLLKIIECKLCGAEQHEKCVRNFCINRERDHVCPNCWEESSLVETGATIIVSPEAIKKQWYSEIKKHVDSSIKVLIYNGISNMRWISPEELAAYDIVLTDYNVLRKEIYFSSSNISRCNLRQPKSYMRVSSPLVMMQWWRVCLDEAQMVESTKTCASVMVKRLPAIHRWAVTGTPIQKSMDDLRGLLQFLGVDPFDDVKTFCRLISLFQKDDTQPLVSVLQKIMWRTCKSSVQTELQIPPRTEIVHYVSLSDLEKLFYKNYHSDCAAAFNEKVNKLGVGSKTLSKIDPKTLKLLLDPLKLLRQSCTVPMLLQKSEQSYHKKKLLEPKELLEHLKTKNEIECKSHLRTIASCYNGMAAIFIIRRQFPQAIKLYEVVMRRAEDHKGSICVDTLLQIHALHNLIYSYENFIEQNEEFIPKIEMYKEQCNKLEWKYIEGYYSNLKKVELIQNSFNKDIANSVVLNREEQNWWRNILNECDVKNCSDVLILRINDERYANYRHSELAIDNLRNIHGVNYLLTVWFGKIMDMRKKVLGEFDKLKTFTKNIKPISEMLANEKEILNDFVKNTFNCHLNILTTTKKKSENTCSLCILKKTLDIYECYIFNKKFDENRKQAEGSRNPTFHETIMRTILSIAKIKNFADIDIKEGENCLHLLDNMKKEYDELWKVWIETEYTVKAYDELDMCKLRLQVFNPENTDKPKVDESNLYILPEEVEINFLQLSTQLANAENMFVRKLARLKYINYLESNTDPGICPICNSRPESKYIVLECGHHLCFECFKTLKKYQKFALTCSICRNSQKYENIYFVTCKPSSSKSSEIVAKGNYSSKIEAVVTAVLKLKEENKEVKILIFSQWESVLRVLSNALKENDITFKMRKSKNFIDDFKDQDLGITCILLLLSQGSKGLNLVEATHVFLVEPILNPGEELQAIDRIHRIGQTRPTFVHRFLSTNTIEEQIFNTISKDCAQKWELNDVTIENIQILFAQDSKE